VFDLAEVRVRLDQMTERIVSRLKDRSRFPQNPAVYERDGVPVDGRRGISLLHFAIEGLENYHASLGRYSFPDQYPLIGTHLNPPAFQRTIAPEAAPRIHIPITDDLFAFYRTTIERMCRPGDDVNSYGETAYIDADLLQIMNERVNVGRHIAAAKVAGNPGLGGLVREPQRLSDELRDSAREETLLQAVEKTAQRYELDPAIARHVFRWVIDETLAVEVAYLQGLAAEDALATLLR
jgi:chorismate mutase